MRQLTCKGMSEPLKIETETTVRYELSSVPCRIRFSGLHSDIPKHFHKIEKDGVVINYLRGRKLHGKRLKNRLHAFLLLKQFDEVTTLGKIDESIWYEREGHKVQIEDKIDELLQLSDLIHDD